MVGSPNNSTAPPAGPGSGWGAPPPDDLTLPGFPANPAPVAPVAPPPAPHPLTTAPETNLKEIPKLLKATYITQGEQLLYESRPTRWIYLPAPVFFFAVVLIIDGFLARNVYGVSWLSFFPTVGALNNGPDTTMGRIEVIVMVLLVLIAVLYFGIRWMRYAATVYVVTSTRVIRQKGILGKDFDEVQLLQVRGVDVRQRLGQRFLRYGTVRLSAEFGGLSGKGLGNEDWPGVIKPINFAKIIETSQERLRGLLGTGAYPSGPR